MKAEDFKGDLESFLLDYTYQCKLTKLLDGTTGEFDQARINEIVLWKVNRYAKLSEEILSGLNSLRHLKKGQHEQSRPILNKLLCTQGVDLPMASTFLRFRNPSVFQIIDRHAYRALYGSPFPTTRVKEKKVEAYFRYLVDLRSICERRGLPFESADRVLYIFDRKKNRSLTKETP